MGVFSDSDFDVLKVSYSNFEDVKVLSSCRGYPHFQRDVGRNLFTRFPPGEEVIGGWVGKMRVHFSREHGRGAGDYLKLSVI